MQDAGAVVVCVLLGALAVLQAGLALGAPWGRLAWGGRHERLPVRLRVASAVSIVLYGAFAVVVLDRAGLVDVLPTAVSRIGTWVLAAYFLLGVVLNGASRSRRERFTMAPACAVLCLACVAVASGPAATLAAAPPEGPWMIFLAQPEGGWSACLDDAAVADALATADLPTSHVSATLETDATRADLDRIVGCLDRSLTGGTMTVTTQDR